MESAATSPSFGSSPPSSEPARPGARLEFVDCAKGLGILLVVLGHALGGMLSAQLVTPADAFGRAFDVIYQFHMPLFLFLSGLFVSKRVARGSAEFMRNNVRSLVPPYLIWLPVQLLMLHLASSQTNASYDFRPYDFLTILWNPGGQFWYLYALLLLHLGAALVLPRFGLAGLFALAFAVYGLSARPLWGPFPFAAKFAPYYALGVGWFAMSQGVSLPRRSLGPLAVAAALAFVAVYLFAQAGGYGYWTVGSVPSAILGSICALACAAMLSATKLAKPLAYLGRESLPIFLLHIMFCAGTRIVLHKVLGWSQPVAVLGGVVAVGLAGPLACNWIAERLGIASLIGFRVSKPRAPTLSSPAPVLDPAR